jgi:glyoxylase-like metal-dependent hydrolase (beta-lactamase superfamily II)
MPRRSRLVLCTAFLALAAPLSAQQNFDTVQVKAVRVADGIYMLTGAGGNIGLATGADATFIIDDQFAPLTPKIRAAIATVTKDPVKFLINTHFHGDHVGGNENFGSAGAIIFAHDNVRRRMSGEQFEAAARQPAPPPAPKAALPVVTFSDTLTLHLNGETAVIYHVNAAHTDGDAMIWFRKANVVHAGDVFVRYGFPFIDVASGGTFNGLIAANEKLLASTDANTKFIPGHGDVATRKDLEDFISMLKTVRQKVTAAMAGGKTIEEVKAAKPLAELDKLGQGFVKTDGFVDLIYRELSKKKP